MFRQRMLSLLGMLALIAAGSTVVGGSVELAHAETVETVDKVTGIGPLLLVFKPRNLAQENPDRSPIPLAGQSASNAVVIFATADQWAKCDHYYRLQAEFRENTEPFTGAVTNQTAEVHVPGIHVRAPYDYSLAVNGLKPNTRYRWRVRQWSRSQRITEDGCTGEATGASGWVEIQGGFKTPPNP